MSSSHHFFKKQPDAKKAKNDVFYVRWGGIPAWDPRTESLKKANTWGMGSGGLSITSLHENKIREIVLVEVEKHNTPLIKNLVVQWTGSKIKPESKDFIEFIKTITQYQIQRSLQLAKGLKIPEFMPPASWPKELKILSESALQEIPILMNENSALIQPKDVKSLSDDIVQYQILNQREDKDEKSTNFWLKKPRAASIEKVALEINEAIDHMLLSMKKSGITPLFYTEKEHQKFYYEYCNKRLWPLFHRHLAQSETKDIFEVAPFQPEAYKEYEHLSEETAKMIAKQAPFGGLVWLHDYHLFLVPEYLTKLREDVKLGYHFHIPVPDGKLLEPLEDDIKRLVTSVVKCNYLSFNTTKDMENFKGIATQMGLDIKHIIFDCNPIGAEPVKTLEKNPQPKTQKTIEEIASLRKKHRLDHKTEPPSFQVVLSVDRIEPSKGLKTRLKAIRDILENPQSLNNANNLLFVMVCPDSRSGIKAYDELNIWFKKEIQELNSLANKKIGRDIIKFHGEMPQTELQALGQHADTFMVTSDADGLHLGPAEWLATQNFHNKDKQVNVVLSSGAGISEYLPHAMSFDPGDHELLTSLICKTTTESSAKKAKRSDKIKDDFEEGPAKGFSLEKWHDKAASGLTADSIKGQDSKFRGPDHTRNTGGKGHYGSMDTTPRKSS